MINDNLFRDLMAHYDPDKQPIQEFRILSNLVKDPTTASTANAVQQILDLTECPGQTHRRKSRLLPLLRDSRAPHRLLTQRSIRLQRGLRRPRLRQR